MNARIYEVLYGECKNFAECYTTNVKVFFSPGVLLIILTADQFLSGSLGWYNLYQTMMQHLGHCINVGLTLLKLHMLTGGSQKQHARMLDK